MNNLPFQRISRGFGRITRAFTLIELLVVITIIAVLAGLLLPVVNKVTNNSYKVQTKAAEMQIISAVKSYQADYGSYPVPTPAGTPTDYTYGGNTSPTSNATLFYVLRADPTTCTNLGLNSRRQNYFEGNDAKNASQPKSGFVPLTATSPKGNLGATVNIGDFLDAWGNEYYVRIDANYTNAVKNPYSPGDEQNLTSDTGSETSTDQTILHFGVVVWTHGADGVIGASPTSIGDDIISWQ